MDQGFLTSAHHHRPATVMRLADSPVPDVRRRVEEHHHHHHLQHLQRPFMGSESKDTNDVQVLNLHPAGEKIRSGLAGRLAEQRGSVCPKSIDELYWMLPGAVVYEKDSSPG
ncbi:uncharacterized protein [Panulirus ornatus]|uniref:uncharacterized protein n=1 Tax=Panulirus ornatus TaxID=150431 RepID=UPI003A86C441